MPTYKVGCLRLADGTFADFLFSATNPRIMASKAVGKDENGNRVVTQHFDHVLALRCTALIPRGSALPVPGSRITLEGISVPTFNPDGTVASGDWQIEDQTGSGSGPTASIEFEVTGEPSVTMQAEALTQIEFDAECPLINGLPTLGSSEA